MKQQPGAELLPTAAADAAVARAQVTAAVRPLTYLRFVNPMYYGLEGVMVNELRGTELDCSQGLSKSQLSSFVMTVLPALQGRLSASMQAFLAAPRAG